MILITDIISFPGGTCVIAAALVSKRARTGAGDGNSLRQIEP